MVVEFKILINSHDNDRIVQREKRRNKFPDTFSEFKQHVSKFVGISDIRGINITFICIVYSH